MKNVTLDDKSRIPAAHATPAAQLETVCGPAPGELSLELSESVCTDEQESGVFDDHDQTDDGILGPTEIIAELQRIGEKVASAGMYTRLCIAEVQTALKLVGGSEDADRVGWRIKGAPAVQPTAAEKAERLELLLAEAFSMAMTLANMSGALKGYDAGTAAAAARVEASLERFSDSPEIFKEYARAMAPGKKAPSARSLNR